MQDILKKLKDKRKNNIQKENDKDEKYKRKNNKDKEYKRNNKDNNSQ